MGARITGLVLTGPVGVGKTTVAVAVGERLESLGVPYSVIDLDWLAWISPDPASGATVSDVLAGSLRALWPVHRAAGVTTLVLARSLRTAADYEALRAALPDVALRVVHLTAAEAVLRQRLSGRDDGGTLAEHLDEVALPLPALPDETRVAADGDITACVEAVVSLLRDVPSRPTDDERGRG